MSIGEDQTINCVICGSKADLYTGHVHGLMGLITAGICDDCENRNQAGRFRKELVSDCPAPLACFGNWREGDGIMGIESGGPE